MKISYSAKIKILRSIHGHTQEELADALFVSQKHYSNLENGKTIIDIDTLERLCMFYKIKLTHFLDWNPVDGIQKDVSGIS